MRMRILGLLTRKGRLKLKGYRSIPSTWMTSGFREIVFQTGTWNGTGSREQALRRGFPAQARYAGGFNTWKGLPMVTEELGPEFIKLGHTLSNFVTVSCH